MNKNQSRSTFAVLLVSMAFAASAQADGVKVGGSVEAGFYWPNTQGSIGLREGNLDFSGEFGRSSFMLDVPFSALTATTTAVSLFGVTSQAFVAHKAESGFRWKAGIFDSMFNSENNRLARGYFAWHSNVYGALPKTQAGWAFGYGSGNWGLDVMLANPRDMSATSGAFLDYGVHFGMTSDKNTFGLGFLYNGTTNNTYMLIDAMAGLSLGKIMLDLEAFYKSVNTGTAANTIGIMATPVFGLSDSWDLGIRLEFLSASPITTIGAAVGPNWNLSKNALVKFGFGINSQSFTGGSTLGMVGAIDGVIRI